jgi:hypothetical protein
LPLTVALYVEQFKPLRHFALRDSVALATHRASASAAAETTSLDCSLIGGSRLNDTILGRLPQSRRARCSMAQLPPGSAKVGVAPLLGTSATSGSSSSLDQCLPHSADQRGRLVNEARIVDLLDKKVGNVGARDKAGTPVACID